MSRAPRATCGKVGPPPPLDAELAATYEFLRPTLRRVETKDDIATLRAPTSSFPTPASDEALSANGFFRVEQRRVASVPGAPDINLLMCLPKARTSPTPAFYYVHGGGLRRRRRSSRAIVAVLRWRARS